MSTEERRAPGATRYPFEALVEVGGALGPTFEAQAINVSEEGIQLRTAYLPEPGQPLTCRFDTGAGESVLAAGEVAWARGGERGGEFGVRFTEMDAESVHSLKRVCGVGASAPAVAPLGGKVRLHIDGLASPMRAKVKDAQPSAVTVGSDLGFLQVGKPLELEDAQTGTKRPASIDRVEVAVDPASQVPQLVVTLRYQGAESASEEPRPAEVRSHGHGAEAKSAAPRPSMASVEAAAHDMRGAFARSVDKVRPALGRMVAQMKTTVAVLAKRGRADANDTAPRRTTAPPPGGGLYAAGRRVVRGEPSSAAEESVTLPMTMTKRRAAVAGGVMVAAILGALALKKMHHEPAPDTAAAPALSATPAASVALAPPPVPPSAPASAAPAPVAMAPSDVDDTDDLHPSHKKHIHVTPFGNGPVHHANVLRLKMDGPIESIEGAQQPTGFVVKIPGRKSLEPASPLAARDARIATIKVANEGAGAELTLAFRDGVPNYQVSARGDTLVISLAPAGTVDHALADKDEKGARSGKHTHHAHAGKGEQSL